MVQSRLQYSLAYGGQSPSALAAFYHPAQMSAAAAVGYGANHFSAAETSAASAAMLHHPHSAFLSTQSPGSHYSTYSGYTPPPGAYQLHQAGLHQDPAIVTSAALLSSTQSHQNHSTQQIQTTNGSAHNNLTSSNEAGENRSSESPIDFSSATNSQYSGSWQQDGNSDTDVLMRNLTSSFTPNTSSIPAVNGSSTHGGKYHFCLQVAYTKISVTTFNLAINWIQFNSNTFQAILP